MPAPKILVTIAVDPEVIYKHFDTSKEDMPIEAREGIIVDFVGDLRTYFDENYDGEIAYDEENKTYPDFYLEGFEWQEV